MVLAAGAYRYRALREGLSGWDCWALQAALGGLVKDGEFGPATASAVRSLQSQEKLLVDGIAGTITQREAAYRCIWPAQEDQETPSGLLRGVVEGESGFLVGNHTAPYPNGTRDLGLCMFNMVPTVANMQFAFDARKAIMRTAQNISSQHDTYLNQPGVKGDQRLAWRFAVGRHNWPAAADRFADGTIGSWRYVSRGVSYRMSDPAPWVREIGVAGVDTGYEWFQFYVDSKVLYCPSLR